MRPTFKEFKIKALKDQEVKKEYDRLKPLYDIKAKLVRIRLAEGLTQEEIARKMNTTKSNISRLESTGSKIMPNISTLMDYAAAMGYDVRFDFTKIKKRKG
ncbi:MAG: helix-turn-helix transcriptional regulator [Deltaproteobacteria bacterium]|jgi:transcriptional regulator with XRE-family HTH domain|nr:helix-turn-helix domain-containing protein [Deltaproteobacteria bacterium]MCL5880398.1 helix-turn-helix domain-containing protein [Deltaproteobacteria bacterium]MDA8303674.1 helix-turn-helix transcriptional regulator [Deltaproteobacteria bacterium]